MKKYAFFLHGSESLQYGWIKTTHTPGTVTLEALLTELKQKIPLFTEFEPTIGFLKEVLWDGDKARINTPSMAGKERLQAIIVQRTGEKITGEGKDFYRNGEKIGHEFDRYDVNIVEV